MKENARSQNAKVLTGVFLAAAILAANGLLINYDTKLGLFLLVGLLFGYLVTRTRIGFSAIYVEFFNTGSGARFYYLLLMFVVSVIGTAFIHSMAAAEGGVPQFQASGGQTVIPGTSSVVPVDLSLIAGAFLFGSGMVVNKGCGSGTLRNIGKGNGRYAWTLLFILIGAIPGQMAKHAFQQSSASQYSVQMYLPDQFGYTGSVLIIAALFGLLAFLANRYGKKRKEEGTYDRKDKQDKVLNEDDSDESKERRLSHRLFRSKWPALVGVIGTAALLFFSLLTTGDTLKVTQPLLKPAVSLFENLGVSLDSSVFSQPLSDLENGLWQDEETVRNAGVLGGALVYSLTAGSFKFSWSGGWSDNGWYMLSGFLIGFGGILANGCNIGALYSGIVNFSLSGWAVLVFSALGAILTMNVMNGKVGTIDKVE